MIMGSFDLEVFKSFRYMHSIHKPIKITGDNTIYNFVEEVHNFKIGDFELKSDDGLHERADHCQLVSVNARNNPVEPAPLEVLKGGKGKGKKKGRPSRGY